MMDNHVYNLMMQLVQESKSCKRIDDQYIHDAEGHEDCIAFWTDMKKDKEEHIRDLEKLIRAHL